MQCTEETWNQICEELSSIKSPCLIIVTTDAAPNRMTSPGVSSLVSLEGSRQNVSP